jgi:hypothetical protein
MRAILLALAILALSSGFAEGQTTYNAPDGSLSLRVPPGWRASASAIGTTPVQLLQPAAGGDERIIVGVGPARANSIQELAQQGMQLVTQQLLPGSRLASQPKYTQVNGAPAAELSYAGPGQSVWWQGITLRNGQYIGVLGGARPQSAAMVEQQSRSVLATIRLGTGASASGGQASADQASGSLAQLIVGHWTWYHRTTNAGGGTAGSTSREIWIYPNGRYQYTAVTYTPNLPADIDPTTNINGSYTLQGNAIVMRADSGQQATYTLQVVQGGKGLMVEGELYIRE